MARASLYHRTIDQRFTVSGASLLEFRLSSGNLDIAPLSSRRQAVAGERGAAPDARQTDVHVQGEIIAGSAADANDVTLNGERQGDRYVITISQPHTHIVRGPFSSSYEISFPGTMAVEVNDSAGNVRLRDAVKNVSLHTSAGNVMAAISPAWSGSAIELWSSAGNIELDAPQGFKGVLNAGTDAGNVRNELDLPSSGTGTKINLATNAGNITVRSR